MTLHVRYRGSGAFASLFAQLLRDEGLEVQHAPIVEERGAGEVAVDVIMYVSDKAAGAAIGWVLRDQVAAVIQKFKERQSRAEIKIIDRAELPDAQPPPP